MLSLLYGDEDFLVHEELQRLKAALPRELQDLNLLEMDGSGLSLADLSSHALAVPFLGSKRVVIIHDFLKGIKADFDMDAFGELLLDLPESTDLVFLESSLDKRKKATKLLMDKAISQEFARIDEKRLVNWIMERSQRQDIRITTRAAHLLASQVGADLWTLDRELAKLANYTDGAEVDVDAVGELAVQLYRDDIFQLIDLIMERRVGQALRSVSQNLRSGAHPLYLIKRVVNQFRNVLYAKSLSERKKVAAKDIAGVLDIHPFVAQKALQQARLFKLAELKDYFIQLADLDLDIKKGRIEADLALAMFIAGLG